MPKNKTDISRIGVLARAVATLDDVFNTPGCDNKQNGLDKCDLLDMIMELAHHHYLVNDVSIRSINKELEKAGWTDMRVKRDTCEQSTDSLMWWSDE